MDSKDIGNISELAVMLEFTKKGMPIFIPYGDSCPFDLVVYINDKFYRIEVKTARPSKNGCIIFNPYFCTYEGGRNRKSVNYVEKADIGEVRFRVDLPKNRHKKHIRWASDYEFDTQLEKLFGGVV